MGRINVLDKHVAELIAAGEVVERPSSVIKELVENSVDAGAENITVEIKNGGVTFMRVTDDGHGIMKDDIRKAFIRHATSKVKDENDLSSISTLGFRGEALASVSSVSSLELITKSPQEETGTKYVIEGSVEKEFSDIGCPNGTTFIIRDLFYNVPARKKFLKSSVSEGNAVSNVIDKIALSHPDIAFTYIRDSKQVLKTVGDSKLLSSIYAVYGKEFTQTLLPVKYSLGGIDVKGYVSKPEYAKPNRNMQNFFLNGRYVISKTFMAAISEACKGSVMIGKYPACVLNVDMSFDTVDVNVHPTKLEVRFLNEKPVFDAVYYAVKTALMIGDGPKKADFSPFEKQSRNNSYNPFETAFKVFRERDEKKKNDINADASEKTPMFSQNVQKKADDDPLSVYSKAAYSNEKHKEELIKEKIESSKKKDLSILEAQEFLKDEGSFSSATPESKEAEKTKEVREIEEEKNIKTINDVSLSNDDKNESIREEINLLIEDDNKKFEYIGELFRTYLIAEISDDELLLIDKHAAHERIMYDELRRSSNNGCEQLLLVPLSVTLNKNDYNAVINNLDLFKEARFEIEDFGEGSVLVRSIPQYLENEDIESTIEEMAGYLSEHKNDIRSAKMEWIYQNIACRAAVKGGDRNSRFELESFAKRVIDDPAVRHCPHGRPVCVTLRKRDIEKNFGRIV